MDALTRERYPRIDLAAERRGAPKPPRPVRLPPTLVEVMERRIDLCGTADLAVMSRGGPTALERHRRLVRAIRRAA